MTPEDAQAHIAASDPRFALTEAVIGGVRYPVFANAPAHLRVLLEDAAPAYGDRDTLVYQDERWRHAELCREVRRVPTPWPTTWACARATRWRSPCATTRSCRS